VIGADPSVFVRSGLIMAFLCGRGLAQTISLLYKWLSPIPAMFALNLCDALLSRCDVLLMMLQLRVGAIGVC
jgi:hypothetical protein